MRKTILILAFSFLLAGCATTSPFDTQQIQGSVIRYIEVSSQPGDADIYVNNMLVGKTPDNSDTTQRIPINIRYIQTKFGGLFITAENTRQPIKPIDQFILRISKKGYKDYAMPIEYADPSSYHIPFAVVDDYTFLKKQKYHFVLEKAE